jgi:hypothetical protein
MVLEGEEGRHTAAHFLTRRRVMQVVRHGGTWPAADGGFGRR